MVRVIQLADRKPWVSRMPLIWNELTIPTRVTFGLAFGLSTNVRRFDATNQLATRVTCMKRALNDHG